MATTPADRDTLTTAFETRFGAKPTGIWVAPGRVNLIGEHTDYNQGFVLPFAIDRHATVAARARDDGQVRVSSMFSDEVVEIGSAAIGPGAVTGWSAYPLGVSWALARQAQVEVAGFDLLIDSDVPTGAGLSSSAAIECATAVALNQLWNAGLSRMALARVGQDAENTIVGAPTGIMDQAASMLGEQGAAVFLDCRSLETRPVALGLARAELEVLVIDTKVIHEHATGGYAARRGSCELAARIMGVDALRDLTIADLPRMRQKLNEVTFRRARHVVTEDARVQETVRVLGAVGPQAIGDLLNASHASMRDDFEISVPELDLAVEISQQVGAIGARMTGGGFGGSAIALIPRGLKTEFELALGHAFSAHGYVRPDTFVVEPSDGATMAGDIGD